MATAAALATDGSAITFNPAWISATTVHKYSLPSSSGKITNYIVPGELVSKVQAISKAHPLTSSILQEYGTNVLLSNKVQDYFNFSGISLHGIDAVIERMKMTPNITMPK